MESAGGDSQAAEGEDEDDDVEDEETEYESEPSFMSMSGRSSPSYEILQISN